MSDAVPTETVAPAAPADAPQPGGAETDEIAAALAAMEDAGEPSDETKEPAPKADDKAEPKKEAKADDDRDEKIEEKGPPAKGWAAVRRVEQKLQKRSKEFEAKEQQFNAQRQQFDHQIRELQQRQAELEQDPVAYLTKKGLSFDDLAKRYLNDGKASPEEMARRQAAQGNDELKKVKENQARLEAALEQSKIDNLVGEYKGNIKTTIAADDLELLRAWPDAEAEVFDFANKWAPQHGEVLTPRDAALKLQTELRKQLQGLLSHQSVLKLVPAGNGGPKQVVSGQGQAPRGPGASPRTLTNNLAATPPASEPDFDSLTEEEQLQSVLRLVQDA